MAGIETSPKIVPLHRVRAACEPQDKELMRRFGALGGSTDWARKDVLIMIRVLSSLEDDLELDTGPANQTTRRLQATSKRRVRRLLETWVGDDPGRVIDVRKKVPLPTVWKCAPSSFL